MLKVYIIPGKQANVPSSSDPKQAQNYRNVIFLSSSLLLCLKTPYKQTDINLHFSAFVFISRCQHLHILSILDFL